MLQIALIGPEDTGKSKLFELLTKTKPKDEVLSESFSAPIGNCSLDEKRINALQGVLNRPNVIPLSATVLDFPGFSSKTPSRLLNQIIPQIKQADLLLVVLKAMSEYDVSKLPKVYSAFRDDLFVLDLSVAENAIKNLKSKLRAMKHPEEDPRYKLLTKINTLLDSQKLLASELTPDEREELKDLALLTAHPWLVVLNLGEDVFVRTEIREGMCEHFGDEGVACCALPVKLAVDLEELDDENERAEFRKAYGITEPPLPPLKKAILTALNLSVFYTFNEKEVRGWSVRSGGRAIDAAGQIHSDLAKGFIRADVISFEDFINAGSESGARERNLWRTEGRDYLVQDGDIILVKFKV